MYTVRRRKYNESGRNQGSQQISMHPLQCATGEIYQLVVAFICVCVSIRYLENPLGHL